MKNSKSWISLLRKKMMSYADPPTDAQFKLVREKIQEWGWMYSFINSNPDVKERYEVHKTFEILNNEQLSDR